MPGIDWFYGSTIHQTLAGLMPEEDQCGEFQQEQHLNHPTAHGTSAFMVGRTRQERVQGTGGAGIGTDEN